MDFLSREWFTDDIPKVGAGVRLMFDGGSIEATVLARRALDNSPQEPPVVFWVWLSDGATIKFLGDENKWAIENVFRDRREARLFLNV